MAFVILEMEDITNKRDSSQSWQSDQTEWLHEKGLTRIWLSPTDPVADEIKSTITAEFQGSTRLGCMASCLSEWKAGKGPPGVYKKNNKKHLKDPEHTVKTMQERLRDNSESDLSPDSALLFTDPHLNIQTEVKSKSRQE